MKLNLFKRSMIFATFFGSCLCIALIVASLGTTHWVDATAKRMSLPNDSEGKISIGLFFGLKELNYAYGRRSHDFSVKAGNHPARRWAWCGTAALLGVALASACGAGVLATLGAATRRQRAAATPLLATNALAVVFILGAISVWVTEFVLRLQHNVLPEEEVAVTWSSEGMAQLGYSFWLVVAAAVASFVNIICVCVAMADQREQDSVAPALEEKKRWIDVVLDDMRANGLAKKDAEDRAKVDSGFSHEEQDEQPGTR